MPKKLWNDFPNVIRMQQFSRKALTKIVEHAIAFERALRNGDPLPRESDADKNWRVTSLFYEASTRTSATFSGAVNGLAYDFHAVADPGTFSSAVKGESFKQAIAAFTCTGGMGKIRGCDLVILRHNEDGASAIAAKVIETALRQEKGVLPLPVINAGDGAGQHPTQALVDLTTIFEERNTDKHPLDDLTILFPGDLRNSRVVNSLLYALGKFGKKHNIKVVFCCPEGFGTKDGMLEYLARNNVKYSFAKPKNFAKEVKKADIVYMTRIQRERTSKSLKFPRKARRQIVFRKEYLDLLKPGAFVMHPLPINEDPDDGPAEIDVELLARAQSGDPRLVWMRQSHRGLPVRMALLDIIFAGLDKWLTA